MSQKKKSDYNSDILTQINSIEISEEELWELNREAEDIEFEEERGLSLIAQRYESNPMKAIAIHLRMQALIDLLESNELIHWTLPAFPDGGVPIDKNVFIAAAVEPLSEIGGEIRFDSSSFLDRVLELTEAAGKA